ncbi:MAG: hypothetical protein O3C21_03250 [Verrucomicrobia bacterium]|nr:hypothetical protein [Verrucomicrobiota bacterium]
MSALEDTPLNRFVTFGVTAAIFGSFGLITGVILFIGTDDSWTQLEAPAAEARSAKLSVFRDSIPKAAEIDSAAAAKVLSSSKAAKSAIVVPGSPTALEQAQNPVEKKHDPAESELLEL